MLYLIVKTNLRPFMPIREFLNNLKHKFLTQSVPGSYKKPLSAKTCLFFLLLGLLNIALGIITLNIYRNLLVLTLPYGLGTKNQSFTIPKQTKAPLYVYLQIDDFYQSHLFYAKSYSSKQLKGDATDKIGTCKPLKYADGKIIYPCGLMANTFNQDAFRIVKNGRDVPINDKDIAWSSSQKRIKNTKYNLDQITAPPDWEPYNEVPRLEGNERFANWMSQSSFANFRKLYGKIDNGLSEGDYELVTNSKFPYGRLSLVLAESSWAGGKNYFLSVLMIVCGSILVLGSALLFMKSNTFEA